MSPSKRAMPAPPRKDTSAQEGGNRQKEIETLHRVFNKLDCKGDGKIDEQELSTCAPRTSNTRP